MSLFLYLGGAYHLAWVIFESLWPILWNWKKTLEPVDDLQKLLPRLTSRGMVALYLGIAYLSFFQTSALLSTALGRDILIFVVAIWTARTILQIWYFGLIGKANAMRLDRDSYRLPFRNTPPQVFTNAFLIVFAFGIMCYAVPLIHLLRSP